MKIKHKLLIFFLTFIIVFVAWFLYQGTITGFSILENKVVPAEEGAPIQVYFCPRDDCKGKLITLIENSENVDCALYDLTISEVKDALKTKPKRSEASLGPAKQNVSLGNYRLIVDKDNAKYVKGMNYKTNKFSDGLMHNKFCIFDNSTVFTGSFNPTSRQNSFDANNILIINSKYLAENYLLEFEELWASKFAEGEPVKYQNIIYNNETIENYFCPEDACTEHLLVALAAASAEIKFMTFSFTDDAIGNLLLEKAKNNISVSGVFDKSQAGSEFSEFHRLNGTADVRRDNTIGLLHHKVFIVDRKIVATGSFNPSKNADTKNDENLIIIHSPAVAERFLGEFDYIWENNKNSY